MAAMQAPTPLLKHLVLVGGGHSHLAVLRRLGMQPVPGLMVTLISRDILTPYSGSLPGCIAGRYSQEEMHIDLRPLSNFAGARLIQQAVGHVDLEQKLVQLEGQPDLPFDLISFNTGSRPDAALIPGAVEFAIGIKPIDRFLREWEQVRQQALSVLADNKASFELLIVGGGPASVEFALAAQARINTELGLSVDSPSRLHIVLATADPDILPGHNDKVRRFARHELTRRGIELRLEQRITAFHKGQAETEAGEMIRADAMVYATGASLANWLRETGLKLSEDGFIEVNNQLQSSSHDFVFAAGDNATIAGEARPKSGVYAVRQGKILAHNLPAFARGKRLRRYKPQKQALALMNLGNGRALASRGSLFLQGKLIWQAKHRIDTAFLKKYRQLPAMQADLQLADGLVDKKTEQQLRRHALRCAGCGGKVAGDVLGEVLATITPQQHSQGAEDAAVIPLPDGRVLLQSLDYLRSFINDPWLFGQIAALHSLSDLHAMGSKAHSALALAGIPPASHRYSKQLLLELMQGVKSVLDAEDCQLLGGHSAEAQELQFGLCVNGFARREELLGKRGMAESDALILCKALGTGTLLAADMRYRARHDWMQDAIASMLISNRQAGEIFVAHGASACTDVTGFGLAGHLTEMLGAKSSVTLNLDDIPALDGALDCLAQNIVSSLQADNAALMQSMDCGEFKDNEPRLQLLFDPQTSGGLLASVPVARAEDCLAALKFAGYRDACCIGFVDSTDSELPTIKLR